MSVVKDVLVLLYGYGIRGPGGKIEDQYEDLGEHSPSALDAHSHHRMSCHLVGYMLNPLWVTFSEVLLSFVLLEATSH